MRKSTDEVHVSALHVGTRAGVTLGEGTALALRRILFMYGALAAAAISHPRNLTLASVAATGVPHSVRRRAFLRACAQSVSKSRQATRIPVR
jgi:hypothetical protein